MIALWGVPGDGAMDAVAAALARRSVPALFIDAGRPDDVDVALEAGAGVTGSIRAGDRQVPIDDLTAVYVRPYHPASIPALRHAPSDDAALRRAYALYEALSVFTELTAARVVNRLSANGSNGSKPYQAALIAAAGFRVPETLVTTDPDAARAFADHHGKVIYKSVSSIRSVVRELDADGRARLDDVAGCPTQLQRHVPGVDYRVHVVGDELFATRVLSDAIDYRYPRPGDGPISMAPAPVPPGAEGPCLALARRLGLDVAGLDLRLAPDGDVYCFEVNPAPAFHVFDDARGTLADRIAALLSAGQAAAPAQAARRSS
jgi:hypothetical protein